MKLRLYTGCSTNIREYTEAKKFGVTGILTLSQKTEKAFDLAFAKINGKDATSGPAMELCE